jgi:polygalacturonase
MLFRLLLVCCAMLCVDAATAPGGLYNVRDFGAMGDGVKLETAALNRAVETCARAGGGTVYVPAGTYLTGTIRLKSNITLWIDSGATLLGSKDLKDYQTAVEGQDWFAAMILAKGVQNVAIIGRGIIDGNRVSNPNGEEKMRGPHAALFFDCRDAAVRDVSVRDAANYALVLRSCEGVNIDGITARGGWDGINMHDTRNATIANCDLKRLAPKASIVPEALTKGWPRNAGCLR